jgi:hypothetical protein
MGIKNSSIFGFTHFFLCLFAFVLAKAGLAVSDGAPFLPTHPFGLAAESQRRAC